MITTKKNGKIEFYRFIFCIAILLFHMQKYLLGEASLTNGIHFALFPHGAMGVEFFFLLSGFLMAKSVYKSIPPPRTQIPNPLTISAPKTGFFF